MKTLERVIINPNICMGQPVIKGTRITVSVILKMVANGAASADVVKAYPELSTDDVKEALLYAAWSVSDQVKLPA